MLTPNYFSVNWRNPGHWDIYDENRRLFCIRGGPGNFFIRDERERGGETKKGFPTVASAMVWICETLMQETHGYPNGLLNMREE